MTLEKKKPELILPAGSEEKLLYAFAYGADAVYAGLPDTSLRAQYNEFDERALENAIDVTHREGKKLYVALNIFARDNDFPKVDKFLKQISEQKPDGLILSDPGILNLIHELRVDIPLHLSTQASTTNSMSIRFWRDQGISRIILARELRFGEIEAICQGAGGVDIEIFIHGALCISYSGRCLLSNFLTGRDANKGECAGSCRWRYALVEESRKREKFEIEEDIRGTYILNSKDLCLLEKIPRLGALPIDGYKVEGRTKNILYVSIVARAYRKVINDVFDYNRSEIDREALELLELIDNHGFTNGFIFPNRESMQNYHAGSYRKQRIAGLIKDYGKNEIHFEVKNPIHAGDRVIGISPDKICPFTIKEMFEGAQMIKSAYGSQRQFVRATIDRNLEGAGWNFGIIVKTQSPDIPPKK
jgi:putative protease